MADGTDQFKRRVAEQQAQVRARVNANRGIAEGLEVKPASMEEFQAARNAQGARAAGTQLKADFAAAGETGHARAVTAHRTALANVPANNVQVGTATQAEFDAARQRAAASRGPTLQTRPSNVAGAAQASTLSPAEVDSFNRQSQGRFGQKFPQARGTVGARTAPAPPLPASTPAGQVSFNGARTGATIADNLAAAEPAAAAGPSAASRAVRLGASPVQTTPGRLGPRTAPGQRGGAGGLIAAEGILSAADSVTRPTEDYYRRLGMDESKVGQSVLKDTGVRTLGVLSDLGANLVDHTVVPLGNALGRIAGAAGVTSPALTSQSEGIAATFGDRTDLQGGAASPAAPGAPDFSNVTGGSATRQGQPTQDAAARQAANGGITPVADRTGDPNEVLGTFNGRAITRAESDQLSAGGPPTGSARSSIADNLYRPDANNGGFVSAGSVGGGAEERMRDISDSSTPAGRLYAQLAQDKTPTGKRVAAQFLSEYLGTGTAERGQNAGLQADALGANASLLRGREGDASQERQVRANRRPQYQVGDDGSIVQLDDGVASAVRGEDGKPAKLARAPKGGDLGALKQQEELIGMRIGKAEDYGTPEEYQAARQQALAALMQELGIGANLDGA